MRYDEYGIRIERTESAISKKYDECIMMNRVALGIIGIWPLPNDASKSRILIRSLHLGIIYIFIGSLVLFQWFDIYTLWGDIDANTETFMSNIFVFAVVVKITNFLIFVEAFKDILRTMRCNWIEIMVSKNSREQQDIMYESSIKARDHSTAFAFFISIAGFMYVIMSFISQTEGPVKRDRRYPFFGRYYIDRDSDFVYGVCYLSQIISCTFVAIANYATDTMFIVCVYHICAQLRILQLDFKALGSEGFTDKYRLVKLIQRHQVEIRNVRILQTIFSALSFQQLFVSCVMICVNGFQLIVSLQSNRNRELGLYFSCIPLTLFQILFYCQPGNELMVQSELLSDAIYQSSWINLDRVTVKHLIFIIQRSQKPMSITAGKIYILSLQNFMKIVKTAMSALSVLNAMYRKDN